MGQLYKCITTYGQWKDPSGTKTQIYQCKIDTYWTSAMCKKGKHMINDEEKGKEIAWF